MKAWILNIIVIIVALGLLSCEEETRITKTIENRTDFDICIVIHSKNHNQLADTILIPSGEIVAISNYEILGNAIDTPSAMDRIESIEYISPPGIVVVKDIGEESNWLINSSKCGKMTAGFSYDYNFVLNSEDVWTVTLSNVK